MRTCKYCGDGLPPDAHPKKIYCSTRCKNRMSNARRHIEKKTRADVTVKPWMLRRGDPRKIRTGSTIEAGWLG